MIIVSALVAWVLVLCQSLLGRSRDKLIRELQRQFEETITLAKNANDGWKRANETSRSWMEKNNELQRKYDELMDRTQTEVGSMPSVQPPRDP